VTSACGLTCVELTYAADLRLAKAGIDIGVEFLKVENGNSDIEACDAAMRRCLRFKSMCLRIAAVAECPTAAPLRLIRDRNECRDCHAQQKSNLNLLLSW